MSRREDSLNADTMDRKGSGVVSTYTKQAGSHKDMVRAQAAGWWLSRTEDRTSRSFETRVFGHLLGPPRAEFEFQVV